jgi:hypothetical protein
LVWQGFRDWVPQEEEEEKKRSTEGFAGEGEEEENRGAQEGEKFAFTIFFLHSGIRF